MRVALIVLGAVLIPTCVYAASLPLDDGDFTKGKCKAGSSDYLESYDIQTANYKPVSGRRILYPQAEGQEGGCYIKKKSALRGQYTLGMLNAKAAVQGYSIVQEHINSQSKS